MAEFKNYVFHFTGKLNQSYVMELDNDERTPVYEAVCEKMTLFKATPFTFKNLVSGWSEKMTVSHTVTTSAGAYNFSVDIDSYFKLNGENIWNVLSGMGIDFRFSLRGVTCCYRAILNGEHIGDIETAGTEAMKPKYKNNPLGKIPAEGIYRISGDERYLDELFLLTFALTKTNFSMKRMG